RQGGAVAHGASDARSDGLDAAADPVAPRTDEGALSRVDEASGARSLAGSTDACAGDGRHSRGRTPGGVCLCAGAPEGRLSSTDLADDRRRRGLPQPLDGVSDPVGSESAVPLEAEYAEWPCALATDHAERAVAYRHHVPAHRGQLVLSRDGAGCLFALRGVLGVADYDAGERCRAGDSGGTGTNRRASEDCHGQRVTVYRGRVQRVGAALP